MGYIPPMQPEGMEILFVRWSPPHLAALAAVILCMLMILLVFRKGAQEDFRFRCGRGFAILLFVCWLVSSLVPFFLSDGVDWKDKLPLHFCNLMTPVCCAALWFRAKWACSLAYFGIMAACVQALVTPSLVYGFPRFEYFDFFISHGLLFLAGLFIPLVLGWRAERSDVVKVLLMGDAYLICIIPVNLWLGTNYGFTRIAPPGSILEYLGQAPWYFLTMQIPAMAILFLLYLPVRNRKTHE